MPELGVIPSLAGADHVHPFGWKLYVGANKTDRTYGRLDRNFKAKSGNWIFLFYQPSFVLPTHFCRQNFCCSFCKHTFFEASVFFIVETWDFRESENSIRKNASCDKCNFPRIIHKLGTSMSRKFGKHEAKFLDHQFEVPQNERRFFVPFFGINSVCAWKSRFPIKKGPNPYKGRLHVRYCTVQRWMQHSGLFGVTKYHLL